MACLAGTLLNRTLQDILILVCLPRILTKSAQPRDHRKHGVSLWRCSSHQCQPVPTFRPGHLPPWAPVASAVVDCCASGSLLEGLLWPNDNTGRMFVWGVYSELECWKVTSCERSQPAAGCHRRQGDHLLVLFRARGLQIVTALTVLLPHFRCYHSSFHFCFWNIPGTTESYPSNWCQIYIQSCPPPTTAFSGHSSQCLSLGKGGG